MKTAITEYGLHLKEVPVIPDDVFILATSETWHWFLITDHNTIVSLDDDEILEYQQDVIFELLGRIEVLEK